MTSDRSNQPLTLLTGVGLGVGLMYLADPGRGARRRAAVRDTAVHALHRGGHAAGTTGRDLRNRTRGLWAKARSRFRRDDVDDARLVDRVRAELGRAVSHPRAIVVTAEAGRVTLCGPVLAHEVDRVLAATRKVRGVAAVNDRLEVHARGDHIPSLQGGTPRQGHRPELLQTNWAPAPRLLAGATGAAMVALALRRRDAFAPALGAAGVLLATRAVTNLEFRRLFGVGAGRRAIDLQKAINISAPVERVFAFWSDYKHFPHFMSHVREVRDQGNGRSHWVVDGPPGVPLEWDAEIIAWSLNELLAWRSVPGSSVDQAGLVRFDPMPDGSTRVHLRLLYKPPGGAVGHGLAVLLGVDPKRRLDDDLARVKILLETGHPPHDAAAPTPRTRRELATEPSAARSGARMGSA
jgi:uncharacterized membrane protein